jgi:hypothetical protein
VSEKKLEYGRDIPLYQLLELPPGFLQSEIKRMARDFGIGITETRGTYFSQPMVSVSFRTTSYYTETPDE